MKLLVHCSYCQKHTIQEVFVHATVCKDCGHTNPILMNPPKPRNFEDDYPSGSA